jgi:FtsP/CotA-like multicopper oxidase with cupredoxin domain
VIYDDAWGFEGQVPGPLLRVRVGDLVEVHLRNALSSHRTHNIDFHFVMGPGGGASALSVAPGEEAALTVERKHMDTHGKYATKNTIPAASFIWRRSALQ